VLNSRGSIIPLYNKLISENKKTLPLTNENMSRFFISLDEGVKFVLNCFERMIGGEIFIPKIPSYKILDVAKAVAPECEIEIVGIRPGEKIHEEMITSSDSYNTFDLGKYYTILPSEPHFSLPDFINNFNAVKVPEGFVYNSGSNNEWVDVESLKLLIEEHVVSKP
jgi:FlaA1/EpsC-like NDP-sugar epimerase